jgi:hypothetical protein
MEDVLDLYAEPYDPARPVVGFDERPLQLVAETRTPLPTQPGLPRRFDDEDRRNGTCNLFTTIELLAGWRHVEVPDHLSVIDFAHEMKWLVDEAYPEAGQQPRLAHAAVSDTAGGAPPPAWRSVVRRLEPRAVERAQHEHHRGLSSQVG